MGADKYAAVTDVEIATKYTNDDSGRAWPGVERPDTVYQNHKEFMMTVKAAKDGSQDSANSASANILHWAIPEKQSWAVWGAKIDTDNQGLHEHCPAAPVAQEHPRPRRGRDEPPRTHGYDLHNNRRQRQRQRSQP